MNRVPGSLPYLIAAALTIVTFVGCDGYFRIEGTVVAGEFERVEPLVEEHDEDQAKQATEEEVARGVPDVMVRFEHSRGVEETKTDGEGRFSLSGVSAHLWWAHLEFGRRGFRSFRYRVKGPLESPHRIRVTLVPESDIPPSDAPEAASP